MSGNAARDYHKVHTLKDIVINPTAASWLTAIVRSLVLRQKLIWEVLEDEGKDLHLMKYSDHHH